MRQRIRRWIEDTTLGRLAYKTYVLGNFYPRRVLSKPVDSLRFLINDPEIANFTYEIANYDELHRILARSLGVDEAVIRRFSDELRGDADLERRLGARLSTRRDRKPKPMYGRRTGWYCAARVLHPKLVIETGVADGLGSAVLLRALERNRAEGHPGRLVGIDIDPRAGWAIDDELRSHYELIIEDSKTALPRILAREPVGLFVHDSNHHYEHEMAEYQILKDHLAPLAVILSDNAHAVPALSDFSAAEGRVYGFFHETPLRHFYAGAGIGISTDGR